MCKVSEQNYAWLFYFFMTFYELWRFKVKESMYFVEQKDKIW